jgi:hypothetical protein
VDGAGHYDLPRTFTDPTLGSSTIDMDQADVAIDNRLPLSRIVEEP